MTEKEISNHLHDVHGICVGPHFAQEVHDSDHAPNQPEYFKKDHHRK